MLILISISFVLALLALRYGTDSRPGFDERRDGERFGVLR